MKKENGIRCVWLESMYDLSLSTGKFTHCCKMPPMQLPQGSNVVDNPITNRIKKEFAQRIRSPECAVCWQDEHKGLTSYRQRYLADSKTLESSYYLQFELPSYCQGTCYYCRSSLSTSIASYGSWIDDRMDRIVDARVENTKRVVSLEQQLKSLDALPNDRNLTIGMVGGEPLIKDNVSDWLPQIVKHAKQKFDNLTVNVCTNGWTKHDVLEEFYSLCNNLKVHTNITISLENTGTRAEWVRGCDWQHLNKTVDLHRERADLMNLRSTENFLSVSNLADLIGWYYKKGFDNWDSSIVQQPQIQTEVLPDSYRNYILIAKNRVRKKDKKLLTMLDRIDRSIGLRSSEYANAVHACELIDKVRGTDVHSAFPELAAHGSLARKNAKRLRQILTAAKR